MTHLERHYANELANLRQRLARARRPGAPPLFAAARPREDVFKVDQRAAGACSTR